MTEHFIAALTEIKNNNEAWTKFLEALNNFDFDSEFDSGMTSNEVADVISETCGGDLEISTINGISGFYPMPAYGWDGGNAISTETVNLKILSSTDVGSGPIANLVNLMDASLPGISIHQTSDSDVFVIIYNP